MHAAGAMARSKAPGTAESLLLHHSSCIHAAGAMAKSKAPGKTEYKDLFMFYLKIQTPRSGTKYQIFRVLLWEHPNAGEAMDDKDARRRWYESFLPSILTDSGEPRLIHCYTFDVNGFLARLTRAEALALADKPGVRSMSSNGLYNDLYSYSARSCGFVTTASTKRSFIRSRLAF